MANRKTTAAGEPALRVLREGLELELEARIAEGERLIQVRPHDRASLESAKADYYTWEEYNHTLISQAFTTSGPADECRGVSFGGAGPSTPLHTQIEWFVEDVQKSVRRLDSLKARLKLYAVDSRVAAASPPAASQPGAFAQEIFIVHGHDTARREEVARFLTMITSMNPIILHEQANQGRTIVEKFEAQASRAAFAVVLLTGDDEGRLASADTMMRRARQNVVFEMGFFAGALGRSKVGVLYEAGVELPSDLDGLLYTQLDAAGAWKLGLATELAAAGVAVDLNKAINPGSKR